MRFDQQGQEIVKAAIMQPYVFPYLGYFNLIQACDTFVFLDNVQFINRGFVNRNSIFLNGKAHSFTIPLKSTSRSRLINERRLADEYGRFKQKFFLLLKNSYAKAPFFTQVFELATNVFRRANDSLCELCRDSVCSVCDYMGIKRQFVFASEIMAPEKARLLKGDDKIVYLAKKLNADSYINPIGGFELYSKDKFAQAGLELLFIRPHLPPYTQFGNKFVPSLSILDLLMFVEPKGFKKMLHAYELL